MKIRIADLEADALQIFDGAKDFISRMDFTPFIPDNDADLARCIGDVLAIEGMEIVVAEDNEQIKGGIGMLYAPFVWNRKIIVADEMFIWTAPDAPQSTLLRMLRFVEVRMKEHNASLREFVSLSSSPEGVDRVYARMGLKKVQTMWAGTV